MDIAPSETASEHTRIVVAVEMGQIKVTPNMVVPPPDSSTAMLDGEMTAHTDEPTTRGGWPHRCGRKDRNTSNGTFCEAETSTM
jgi:hypothetical protein